MARKLFTSRQEKALLDSYREGASLEAVAAQFGCSTGTVRNTLVRIGEARRSPGVCRRCNVNLGIYEKNHERFGAYLRKVAQGGA